MAIDFSQLNFLKLSKLKQLTTDPLQYLATLAVPTIIDITGKDTSRCRVVTTLLHGNEPSGFLALHQWLTQQQAGKLSLPETNLRLIICSVEAAQQLPVFSQRYLKHGLDINRCFGQKQNHGYYRRANLIAEAINEVSPELVVDLHNTSGSGPAFAVCTDITNKALTIISLFCQNVILSAIKLGALMEQNFRCPVITIECGGSQDAKAHEVALHGIKQLAAIKQIEYKAKAHVHIIHHPLRFKLRPDVSLNYAASNQYNQGVTLIASIERSNFDGLKKGDAIGWLDERGLTNFELNDEERNNVIDKYFKVKNNRLICKQNMKVFMATLNKAIAKTDCLFYLVKTDD